MSTVETTFVPDHISQIAPTQDVRFHSPLDAFVFWLGRMTSMLVMRHSQTLSGGSAQVAIGFRDTLNETIATSRRLQKDGNGHEAKMTLFEAAYDITLLNESQINALTSELQLRDDSLETNALLSVLKRAEMLARLPDIKKAMHKLVKSYEQKMCAIAAPQIAPAPAPLPPPAQLLEVDVQIAKLNKDALRDAKKLPTPIVRQQNVTKSVPSITAERLVPSEFIRYLRVNAHTSPDYTAVQALGARLSLAPTVKAQKLLGELSVMEQLYLYEVVTEHKDVIVAMMSASYEAIPNEHERQVIRAYLVLNNKCKQNVDYDPLLAKIKT